jgi:hypothetical protein
MVVGLKRTVTSVATISELTANQNPGIRNAGILMYVLLPEYEHDHAE